MSGKTATIEYSAGVGYWIKWGSETIYREAINERE